MSMMIRVLAIAGVIAAACFMSGNAPALAVKEAGAVPLAPNSTRISSGVPPTQYQGSATAVVHFMPDVRVACGSPAPGYTILACARGNRIAMPDPCPLAPREFYARIMCHELAHVNGWPGTHGD